MRFSLAILGILFAAHASAAPPQTSQLVRGKTSPAEAEDILGMPEDVVISRDGSMVLIYTVGQALPGEAATQSLISLAAIGPAAKAAHSTRTIGVRFGPDLTYQGYTATGTIDGNGLASR